MCHATNLINYATVLKNVFLPSGELCFEFAGRQLMDSFHLFGNNEKRLDYIDDTIFIIIFLIDWNSIFNIEL